MTNHENYTNFTQSETRLVIEGKIERNVLVAIRDLESECERRGFEIELPVMPPSVEDEAIELRLNS